MELSGHPTHDLVAELVERGAVFVEGEVPDEAAGGDDLPAGGRWLWVPGEAFETGLDEPIRPS